MKLDTVACTEVVGSVREATTARNGVTAREKEVLGLLVRGLTNKKIARMLSITPITVKHHISHLLCKLGAENRLELAVFAVTHGLVVPHLSGQKKTDIVPLDDDSQSDLCDAPSTILH